jgi:peptidoglycan/LPS O-acetylase OafA/YrhL
MEQNYATHSVFKLSKIKALSYLGTISYGLYCYHLVCIFIVSVIFSRLFPATIEKSLTLFIVQFIAALTLSIVVSSLSYRFIEARFLKLKNKFSEG